MSSISASYFTKITQHWSPTGLSTRIPGTGIKFCKKSRLFGLVMVVFALLIYFQYIRHYAIPPSLRPSLPPYPLSSTGFSHLSLHSRVDGIWPVHSLVPWICVVFRFQQLKSDKCSAASMSYNNQSTSGFLQQQLYGSILQQHHQQTGPIGTVTPPNATGPTASLPPQYHPQPSFYGQQSTGSQHHIYYNAQVRTHWFLLSETQNIWA